jgi:hypothetical protein
MLRMASLRTLRDLDRPMAVMVPSTVEITVARMAMVTETYTAETTSPLFSRELYHLSEKPVNRDRDFEELKEKITVTRMGR